MRKRSIYISECLANDSAQVISGKGKNIIPPPQKESLLKLYMEKFKDPIIIVLMVVFFFSVCVALYEVIYMDKSWSFLLEPSGVMTAMLLATGVGFIFEVKADKEFEILNKVKDSRPIKVYRRSTDGARPHLSRVKKHNIVVGDIIKLESGDEIPADGILLDSVSLRIDESNFTGELYANKTCVDSEFDNEATYPSNFLLRGSIVIEGEGIYKVTAIGMNTEEGKGVKSTHEGSNVETPLNRQLEQLGKGISMVSFVIASLIIVGRMIYFFFFDGNSLNNTSFIQITEFVLGSIMIAVTLIVVAVPEGLPMSVTVSLALSMRKMLKENNLVRKLHACETMGAATVICTDKTGTLTKNQMVVMESDFYGDGNEMELVRQNMAINSTAEISQETDGRITTIGNPTECALLKWLNSEGIDYEIYRQDAKDIKQVPFSTENKFMQTTATIKIGSTEQTITLIKGAPEIVLQMCTSIAGATSKEYIADKLQEYQNKAMRTLGFAYNLEGSTDIIFLGIVGISDPIRDDVRDAIDTCMNKAGVRVIIVTGDTPGTANEIGRQIGLLKEEDTPLNITGPEFAAMKDEQAIELIKNPAFKIISRARPNDKARLVMLLQQLGEVVAVTGDGTNDAPALSKAQVGLSMGDGTARAKEASDITIIDNSFSSINKAIMWGRSLYLNIRRFIIFQMTINVCACLIVLLGSFIGLDSPLTVTQMLWVNLIMDTFAAMALSSLPADKGVLNEKPRKTNSHIVNKEMMKKIFGTGLLFFIFLGGIWQLLAHTNAGSVMEFITNFSFVEKAKAYLSYYDHGLFFSIFVMLQFWNIFNAKYFKTNRSLIQDLIDIIKGNRQAVKETYSMGFIWIASLIIVGQIIIVTFGGQMFTVAPLSPLDWVLILLLTSPVLIIADVFRYLNNKNRCSSNTCMSD